MTVRDSGYKQAPSGNVAVDFVWGNLPPQTNDDRSGSSISYNATGGTSGTFGGDLISATVTAASASAGTITYTAANEFVAGQSVTVSGLLGSVAITGITASAGVVTYATSSTVGLSAGQTIVISGASAAGFNGTKTILAVVTNTNFTVTSAATGSTSTATGAYASAFNLTGAVASATTSAFTITNATTDRAVSGASGLAEAYAELLDGIGADYGWGTTTDFTSNVLTETQPTVTVGQAGSYTVPNDNTVNILNGYEAFPLNAANKTTGFNPAYTLSAVVTAASGDGTTVTYTAHNNFSTGQTVSISGLYNYVLAGSNQPIATAIYAPTYTTASAYNLSSVTIASATPTQFTVTNSTVDGTAASLSSTVSGAIRGLAVVTVAASASTTSTPTVTGLTIKEAIRQIGVASLNVGTVTYTTSGATALNVGTVYSQSVTGSQTLGTAVNLVVYKLPTGENPGVAAGTYTYTL